MVQLRRRDLIRSLAAAALLGKQAPGAPRRRTRNVIVFMTDGLRPEEVFTGADAALLEPKLGASEETRRTLISARAEYGRPTDIERREILLPFFWKEVGRKGQIWGNRALGSSARVTNGKNFSYPGYSETFCGFADNRIDSNDKKPNPNVNVLEWLAGVPEFRGRISAFTSWDVFPWILNAERSGLPVNSGWTALPGAPTEKRRLLNRLSETLTRADEGWRYDALTAEAALECLKHDRPRVLFVALDETDGKAHDGNYPAYLRAARAADQVMRDLWETAQSLPSHRGSPRSLRSRTTAADPRRMAGRITGPT